MKTKPKPTNGGARPGSGPKPKRPEDKTVSVSVTLLPAQIEKARRLGDGNISKGLRVALDAHRAARSHGEAMEPSP